jgi:hypothetical protein
MAPNLSASELSAQAVPGWLDLLAQLVTEIVEIEVSSYVLVVALPGALDRAPPAPGRCASERLSGRSRAGMLLNHRLAQPANQSTSIGSTYVQISNEMAEFVRLPRKRP